MEEAWNFFEDILPPEVTMVVFSHFSLEDIVYVSLVCKAWNTYFDTKQIWKQIYELNFGVVNEKSVDLSQNMRWKRLFFRASTVRSWKNEFMKSSTAFFCHYTHQYYPRSDWLSPNGRYHAVVTEGMIFITDIKMAVKIIPMKHNPVSLHSARTFNLSWENVFKRNVEKCHDTKPPKDNKFVMVNSYMYNGRSSTVIDGGPPGEYAFGEGHSLLVLYNIESHAIALHPEKTALMLWQLTNNNARNILSSFNTKFAVFLNSSNYGKKGEAHIVDLSKRCMHCCHIHSKNGFYVPDLTTCNENTCAVFENLDGPFQAAFVSQVDPNKIIFLQKKGILSIWTHGEGLKEITVKDTLYGSIREHVVEINGVKRHWLAFSGQKQHFLDLNNTSDRIDMPVVTKVVWIPKKNKVALVLGPKLTVYDLERKAWCTKLTLDDNISAVLFTKSGNILFVATAKHIHVYLWETALLIASLPHEATEPIDQLHFALDQVLVICTHHKSYYKRIKIKLDI